MPWLVDVFSAATLIGQLVLILFLAGLAAQSITKKRVKHFSKWVEFAKKHAVHVSFLIALTATLGSLYLSKGLGWEPCELCWYQRILMYPLTFIFGVGLLSKDKRAFNYALPLIVLGLLVSSYHYYVQLGEVVTSCSVYAVSCSTKYTMAYGYITIPLIAFSCFASMFTLCLLSASKKKS